MHMYAMHEIGSEFWTEAPHGGEGLAALLPEGGTTLFTMSGRTSIALIIEDILRKRPAFSVYMPDYCCSSMVEPFLTRCAKVVYYDVRASRDGIRCDLRENDCDVVFLMDYFGFADPGVPAFAQAEKRRGKTVIYDATHSLLREHMDYSAFDYVLASVRKWTGVSAGFAWARDGWTDAPALRPANAFAEMRRRAFDMKARYMAHPEQGGKDAFLTLFGEAEAVLDADYDRRAADEASVRALEALDAGRIRRARRENAARLMDGLAGVPGLAPVYTSMVPGDCPMFVPVLVERGRDLLRRRLIDERIYLPVHWPDSARNDISARELSLVCDQRYAAGDMDRMLESIMRWTKEGI
ncbi:MAG: hypothetical protein E7317_07475 [Clostridiales bacterium]|nr:hypothetical protein [Clostridiales bacterium]